MSNSKFNFGQVIYSEVVPTPSKGSVVFVHGQSLSMANFWTENSNSLVSLVKKAGFNTCFVNLDPNGSIKSNASLLNDQLQSIFKIYNSGKLVVVAYGKGGIDTEGAIYYYNSDIYISHVITLGTPFWGSPLSDILYNPDIYFEINGLSESSAEYDLQTSQMVLFRNLYDNSDKQVPFYTVGGIGTNYITGTLIKTFLDHLGKNDDIVLVKSTRRPKCINIGFPH